MEIVGFIQNIGVPQLLLILVIVLLLFGSRKLPGLARSLGSSVRELRDSMGGEGGDDKKEPTQTTSSDKPRSN